MATALKVPMIGVSSLDLVAFAARYSPRLVVAAIDARRGEVFHARYRHVPGGVQRLCEPTVGSPADLAADLLASGEDCLLVGDGALRYAEHFDGLGRVELADHSLAHPRADALVALAHARALREEFINPWELRPLYLRKPDAEANWTTRGSA